MKKISKQQKIFFKYRFLVSKCFSNLKMFPNKLKNKQNSKKETSTKKKGQGRRLAETPLVWKHK